MLRVLTSAQVADWMAFYALEHEPPAAAEASPDEVEERLRKAFGGPRR